MSISRKDKELERMLARDRSPRTAAAIERILADIAKTSLPINKRYRFVKDMYSEEEVKKWK